MVGKCGVWIAHGVGCAWAIDPFTKTVAELRPAEPVVVHVEDGTASGAPLLPGFSLPVAGLFEGL